MDLVVETHCINTYMKDNGLVTNAFNSEEFARLLLLAPYVPFRSLFIDYQGAHVEGPFISPEKKGCHPKQHIRGFGFDPVKAIEKVYGSTENIAIVTIAPELEGSDAAIKYLSEHGVLVSLGHSTAGLIAGERGVAAGARSITHLFNAMQSYHHRDPCLIGLLTSKMLGNRTMYYGIISDGIHTHDSALRLAHRTNPEGLIVITDAIAALGMGDGVHKLGDCVVNVRGLHAILEGTNTTAGSVASMPYCVRHLAKAARCPLEDALICATEKPATLLGLDRKGVISIGSDADLVLINENVDVLATYIAGKLVYANEQPTRAVLTLSKSMFNAGCFSLPYAWKLGGLWVSFCLSFVIAGFNWYGNHILVRASQHLAKKSERSALDYGHFAKKVCDYSDIRFLRNNSKAVMYVVNVTILFYQLGMCSVAILFISDNMVNLLGDYIGGDQHAKTVIMATIALIFIMGTNMFTEMRVVSAFALVSSVFFIIGATVIMQFTIRQPNQWRSLPASTNFTGTIMMIGMSMYSFEGQTMILPVENKLETPEAFLAPNGVLPTTMIICTCFMTALGFYGYTGFGDKIAPTITTNVPKEGLYSTINVFLMLQSMLGHSIAMYVVFDMFFNGFRRKFTARFPNCPKFFVDKGFRFFWVMVTYLMAVLIPKLEIMIPLVGVTSGTLCALVYPPIFEMITFWTDWKGLLTYRERMCKIALNCFVICVGFFAIGAGLYANGLAIYQSFSRHKGRRRSCSETGTASLVSDNLLHTKSYCQVNHPFERIPDDDLETQDVVTRPLMAFWKGTKQFGNNAFDWMISTIELKQEISFQKFVYVDQIRSWCVQEQLKNGKLIFLELLIFKKFQSLMFTK
ncbi:putative N-acetylglucosamine-6-phosphate deacetylase [Ancylostoma caninum]|uniref:N-acetylglucosamine-6-phosphate deacetylase n=2 Tax=Ancylostoma TaxID=29169 RepID=A0A368GLN3_ANCCA|nr:putative N-acetylglucosamine-6-phosphate deacetylase [Ancylostoma caninum]